MPGNWADGYGPATIENVADLLANNLHTDVTPVMSAGVDNIHGYHSRVFERKSTDWPADGTNSTWILTSAYLPPPAQAGRRCYGMACLLDGAGPTAFRS